MKHMKKKIVILGGGTGGLVAANRLRNSLPEENEILLVDMNDHHLYSPSLLWYMVGWREREDILRPLSLLQKKGIQYLKAEVTDIDLEKRMIITSSGETAYDYLVIALGAQMFPAKIPGFPDAAHNLYDLTGAGKIREHIEEFSPRKITILIGATPFRCPAAPYEAALMLSAYFGRKKKQVQIDVATPEQLPMPVAGPAIGEMVVSLLKQRGIGFKPQMTPTSIDAAGNTITFQNAETMTYDLLIGIPPHGAPAPVPKLSIAGENGWLRVNPRTLETDVENVYAIGDVTSIPLPSGKPLPKAGVFAHFEADAAAHNIAQRIKGGYGQKEFPGKGYCFIELGDHRAGYAGGDFYASPAPVVTAYRPSHLWHWGKILFEKWWMWKWF